MNAQALSRFIGIRGERVPWIACICVVLAAAILMRLNGIERAADYDEGVYWESLRAMASGHVLYREIYYSQPPAFLAYTYLFFAALGHSLFAARLAIAVLSLAGLYGIFALGTVLAGKSGGLAAFTLLAFDVPYLMQSQALHAEAPALALAVIGVYCSFRPGRFLAILAGVFIGTALLCKLLVIAAIVPFLVLVAMRTRSISEAVWFCAALGATVAVAALFFVHDMHALIAQVFSYHTAAAKAFHSEVGMHWRMIARAFKTPLTLAALFGTASALLRRDTNAIPLWAWLFATVLSLYILTPLWDHHLVIIDPPLIALAVLALPARSNVRIENRLRTATMVTMALTVVVSLVYSVIYYRQSATAALQSFPQRQRAVNDLAAALPADRLVVSDAPDVAAEANRDTPPWLVDTSIVRIRAGEITSSELIAQASNADVGAIQMSSQHFTLPQVTAFRAWLRQHYRLAERYGAGEELWLR